MNKVVNFHDIQDINWFEEVIRYLSSKFNMIGIDEIDDFYYHGKILRNSCHLTFDDGDITFHQVIFPVLKKYKIPASLFVSPDICEEGFNYWFQEIKGYDQTSLKRIISEFLKTDLSVLNDYQVFSILKNLKIDQIWEIINYYQELYHVGAIAQQNMNLEQLLEVDRYGLVRIGAHTKSHPILANEDDERSKNEISDSITRLENILGHEVRSFAYPNGLPGIDFGPREMKILMDNSCRIAFSTDPGNFNHGNNPLSIPRFGFDQRGMNYVKVKLSLGKYWDHFKFIENKDEGKNRTALKRKLTLAHHL